MKQDVYGGVIRFLALCLLLGMLLASVPLWAQDCRGNSCNGGSPGHIDINSQLSGGDNMASSNLSVGGSRAYAVGGPSFDVDIAQCLASKSDHYLFGVWAKQRVSQNLHCMGLAYLQAGMYEAAKHVLCEVKNAPLSGMPNCPGPMVAEPPPPPVENHDDEIAEQTERIEAQMAMLAELSAEIDDLRSRPAPRAVITKQPALTPEQRAALARVIDGN